MTEATVSSADVLAAAAARAAETFNAIEGNAGVEANAFAFVVPNTEVAIGIALTGIPQDNRMDFLRSAVKAYVANRITTAHAKWLKSCEPWTRYEEAMKADPMQSAIAKPEGDKPAAPDYLKLAADARTALYEGNIQKKGEGTGKARVTRDPLVQQVTQAVTRTLFEAKKNVVPGYKWMDAVKEVGNDGVVYLKAQIARKVAEGADQATLEKNMEDRFLKPARVILGIDTPKSLKDADNLLG